jgi:hypothetical protein
MFQFLYQLYPSDAYSWLNKREGLDWLNELYKWLSFRDRFLENHKVLVESKKLLFAWSLAHHELSLGYKLIIRELSLKNTKRVAKLKLYKLQWSPKARAISKCASPFAKQSPYSEFNLKSTPLGGFKSQFPTFITRWIMLKIKFLFFPCKERNNCVVQNRSKFYIDLSFSDCYGIIINYTM